MKYVLIIGDGMGDEPIAELGGKTPLEAASTPVMDRLARQGEQLLARFVAESFPGTINEPMFDPECIAPENISAVVKAMHAAIQKDAK